MLYRMKWSVPLFADSDCVCFFLSFSNIMSEKYNRQCGVRKIDKYTDSIIYFSRTHVNTFFYTLFYVVAMYWIVYGYIMCECVLVNNVCSMCILQHFVEYDFWLIKLIQAGGLMGEWESYTYYMNTFIWLP
jgi:hypothetical protein